MTLFLGFAAPKAVLMILSSKRTTGFEHFALHTHRTSHRLTANPGLGTFCCGREEDRSETATRTLIHPLLDGEITPRIRFNCHHHKPPLRDRFFNSAYPYRLTSRLTIWTRKGNATPPT
ncbi:MAG: hypothetical protein RJB08_80 [Actinomycetota bacterium]